jgi:hypothetical protein
MRTALIQLSQADDRVPQRGNVVDSDEQPVVTRRDGENNSADVLDLYDGGIPNLTEPRTLESGSVKNSRWSVM